MDGGQRSRILSWMFSWSILLKFSRATLYFKELFHRLPTVWPLSSCQLSCCHPFQIEDHSWELHQRCWRPQRRRWGWEFAFFCDVLLQNFHLAVPGTRELQDRLCHSFAFCLLNMYNIDFLVTIVVGPRLSLLLLVCILTFSSTACLADCLPYTVNIPVCHICLVFQQELPTCGF